MKNRKLVLTDRLAASAKPADKEYNLHDVTLQGFALRVQPTGAKSWIMRRRVNGSPKRITLGDARRMPLDQARAMAHALLSNGTTFEPGSNGNGPSFAAFAEAYVTKRAPHWKPATRRTRDVYLRVTLLPFFADMRMDEIGTADVARWFHDYSAVRPGGANSALSIVHDMFTRARDWGVLPETAPNPCKGIVRNRSAPRGRILNAQNLQRLGAALDRYATRWPDQVDAIRLMLLTGCRSGEILGLRWGEVNSDRLDLADSKTGPRQVLLGEPACALLRRRRRPQRSSYVFPAARDPAKPCRSIRAFWHRVRGEAGLAGDLRLHDLRHTFASQALMQGETLIMTGKLLGHRHAATTERYAHLEDRFLLDAANRVAAEIARRAGRPLRMRS